MSCSFRRRAAPLSPLEGRSASQVVVGTRRHPRSFPSWYRQARWRDKPRRRSRLTAVSSGPPFACGLRRLPRPPPNEDANALVISLDKVSKVYVNTARPALNDVTVEIDKGEFVFLVGSSGSGKSTFLRLILKEEAPTSGRVRVAGKDLAKLSHWKVPALRRQIGCVFQDFRLLPNKTVFENVAFALEVIGKPRQVIEKVVPEVVDLVGLQGKGGRFPHELSGGEQQRVAIARAFVNKPMIVIADEPTGNLDPSTSVGIMKLLDRINRTGTTVIMATHDAVIVDSMRRRVVELDNGKVIRDQSRGVYGYSK
jgi:cell division transport system ATP-binding protein